MVDILHRVGVKASCENVYAALSTRDGLAGWWTKETFGESSEDAELTFRFSTDGMEKGSFTMKVLEQNPLKRVLWQVVDGPAEWISTTLNWDLKQEEEYCVVLFKHAGWKEPVEFMHYCSTKWAIFLMSLKSLVETGAGSPSPDDVKIDNWN